MRILVTNDDGIRAAGIRALVEVARDFGEVLVIAPDRGRSGQGHAITVSTFLTLTEEEREFDGIEAYSCNGTPADCVKFALHEFYERMPDLVLSGVNHGSNASVNVIYSGTMAAAIEGAVNGIDAIGFSLNEYDPKADMTHAQMVMRQIIQEYIDAKTTETVCLNVNIPYAPSVPVKGVRWCRQAKAQWVEDFEMREDPFGRQYFWLAGDFISKDRGEGTDLAALQEGYASIVPIHYDMTDPKIKSFNDY